MTLDKLIRVLKKLKSDGCATGKEKVFLVTDPDAPLDEMLKPVGTIYVEDVPEGNVFVQINSEG